MRCPYCSHPDTKVTDSRESEDGIRRRRECLDCGRRFTTYERVQAAPLMVVKKDGRREEFSREKVRSGIRRSCAKLPFSAAEIDAIVDDIEVALNARNQAEVPSTDVGDLVMERLRELSHVAYVRFAAHYREFRDRDEIEQVEHEIDRLRATPRRSPRVVGASQPPLLPPTVVDASSGSAPRPSATPASPSPRRERGAVGLRPSSGRRRTNP
jgi:transcriptional repressor NrdR